MSDDISLPEAKFSHALDEYYGFLHSIVKDNNIPNNGRRRLVTMNTITPYSIVKDKSRYNMFVLRAYADLVIRRETAKVSGSPKKPPSDIIENANSGDSWSSEYYALAYPNILQALKKYIRDPSVSAKISALTDTLEGVENAYSEEQNKLEDAWLKYAIDNKISENVDSGKYYAIKSDWWKKRNQKLKRLYEKQQSLRIEISDLEIDHLDSNGVKFKELKDNLSKINQVKLPIRPELEDGSDSDHTSGLSDYDIRPAMYPPGSQVFNDLLDEKNDGDDQINFERGYEINRTKKTNYTHDTDWEASGSASKFYFLRANLSSSEKTHFEEQITKIGSIQVGFRAIQNIVIIRGKWYSGSFLKSQEFTNWLNNSPEYKDRLQNIVTSVIVCRGLVVKLNFETDIHQNSWKELKRKGEGGISIAGWNLGLSGHSNSRTEWDITDVTKNSVTFRDGPGVCRIIGLQVESVLSDTTRSGSLVQFNVDDPIPDEIVKDYESGKTDYEEFLKTIHNL